MTPLTRCADTSSRCFYRGTAGRQIAEGVESAGTSACLDRCGEAKMELFDHIEAFYNQRRRHSTLALVSPAVFERSETQTA